jgi:hypothetical protein
MKNTLAYYLTDVFYDIGPRAHYDQSSKGVKLYLAKVSGTGAQCYKAFLSVIYEFS